MLVITIDLVPGGCESYRRTIGTMRIANVSNLADVSDYAVEATEGANPITGAMSRNARCTVERHDRRQCVWSLIAKAAEAARKAEFDQFL
jgi:hypothetical protein